MSTEQCRRLRDAYRYAASRTQTKVIVLMGGTDFFSNGIHLNVIEAAERPGRGVLVQPPRDRRHRARHPRDRLARRGHRAPGDAAAGGVPFAVAADHVVAREDVVLNPYYQHMGGLYGSEYWTYILPRRVGADVTAELTSAPFDPIGTRRAKEIGLIDDVFGTDLAAFNTQLVAVAERLARHADLPSWLAEKKRRRGADEAVKPLAVYRQEEMTRSHECFFGADRCYHEARSRFVWKSGAPCAVPVATPAPAFVADTRPAVVAAPAPAPAPVAAVEPPAEIGWRLVSVA